MILNDAEDIRLGSNTADAVYLGSGKVWPDAYTPISWIQATGTQYIDTGYVQQSSSMRIEMEAEVKGGSTLVSSSNMQMDIGWSSVVAFYMFRVYYSGSRKMVGDMHDPYGPGADFEIELTMSTDGLSLKEAGNVTATASGCDMSVGATTSYLIFAYNTGSGAGNFIQAKLRSFKLYDGGQLVRNLAPVIRNSDGKPGLWDSVTQTFFTNAGTGEFVVPT